VTWEQGQDRTTFRRNVTAMAQAGGWRRLDPVVLQRGAQVLVLELEAEPAAAEPQPTVDVLRYTPADWNELVRRLR
jgi:hypothetical protein